MASGDTPKTIFLGGGDPVYREAPAAGDITPGMLIDRASDGDFQAHGAAGGPAAPLFAMEFEINGGSIADAYEAGDRVVAIAARSGDQVYALIAYGEDVEIGDYLQSDGNGALEAHESDGHPVAVAVEAVDNVLGGAAARIKVEIL